MNTILAPINNAVAWIITQLFNLFSPVFGVAGGATWLLTIMILVVIMRLILVPLFIKQMHTQRAMTALTPRLTEIRKKYKGDREALNAETMKLYQEAGVNPLMGCLPVILQMPIFFALFSVLRYMAEYQHHAHVTPSYHLTEKVIVSAQHAKIFGASIADKVLFTNGMHVPAEAKVVIVVVVLISMTTTYLTVRQSMKRGMMPTGKDSPMGQSQKLMAYIMPLFALTGLYWQFGLVLYWVTTNLWTLGQQYVLLRKYPVGAAAMGPGGNIPIGGTAGKPATASGLTGPTAKPKPRGTTGGVAGKAGKGTGKPAAAAGSGAVADQPPASSSKSGEAGRIGAGGKPASLSKGSGQGAGKPAQAGKPSAGRPAPAGAGTGATGSANGHKPSSSEGGVLRRLGRGRSEPEPPAPTEPETKIVRQQRQRQSRAKRSGKR